MMRVFDSHPSNTGSKNQKTQMPGNADFVHQLRNLLDCIRAHAVEAAPGQRDPFQREIRVVAESLRDDITLSDLETAIGKSVQTFEGYSQRASDSLKQQTNDLRDLLGQMVETVAWIATGADSSIKQLQIVASRLRQAAQLQDLRQMRTSMEESLAAVLEESNRIQSEARSKTETLNAEIERLKGLLQSAKLAASDDPVTGLPARAMAEQAIEGMANDGRDFSIALFVIDRLVSINGRFGRLVGDQVLLNAALVLAEKLRGAALYRWSGPSFLAVFDPAISAKAAEESARRAAALRLEKDFQIKQRSALVVTTCSLHFHRIAAKADADSIIGSLDGLLMEPQIPSNNNEH